MSNHSSLCPESRTLHLATGETTQSDLAIAFTGYIDCHSMPLRRRAVCCGQRRPFPVGGDLPEYISFDFGREFCTIAPAVRNAVRSESESGPVNRTSKIPVLLLAERTDNRSNGGEYFELTALRSFVFLETPAIDDHS